MFRRLVLYLVGVAIVTLSLGGDSHAAKKKRSSAQMDGAILVVSAVDGPMPARPRGHYSFRSYPGTFKKVDGGGTWMNGKNPTFKAAPRARPGQKVTPTPKLSPGQLQWAPRM